MPHQRDLQGWHLHRLHLQVSTRLQRRSLPTQWVPAFPLKRPDRALKVFQGWKLVSPAQFHRQRRPWAVNKGRTTVRKNAAERTSSAASQWGGAALTECCISFPLCRLLLTNAAITIGSTLRREAALSSPFNKVSEFGCSAQIANHLFLASEIPQLIPVRAHEVC